MSLSTFKYPHPFKLESGEQLPELEIAYHTFGTLNKEKNNVVWVCHALTANSNAFEWWKGLFGEKDLFNPNEHFIVCANNLGSCYGTTGPLSVNKFTGQKWHAHFPLITIRDMVNAHDLLRQKLGISKINIAIGGSQGAQQIIEWNIKNPDLFENTIIIAGNARHSPWGIAFNESQRLAVKADRTYYAQCDQGGEKGLAVARSIALLSYRNYNTYLQTQSEKHDEKINEFNSSSYQRYQGEKLVKRFNAYSYVTLLNAMDSHNVARGRLSQEKTLRSIRAKTLVIGINSDLLFPVSEQKHIADCISGSTFKTIDSLYGHDGFLIETKKISAIISTFLKQKKQNSINEKLALSFIN